MVNSMELSFSDEQFPSGTAGCIRDSAKSSSDDMFLVLSAQTIVLPDIQAVINDHKKRHSDLTVLFCQDTLGTASRAQFYLCDRAIIKHIPSKGYFDIKESLIPELFREGKKVTATKLLLPTLSFRNRAEYLNAIWQYLANGGTEDFALEHWNGRGTSDVVIAADAAVDSTARIFGPVIVMNESVISEKAVIFGPAVIGRKVYIGSNSLVEKSVLWDGSSIGNDCLITNCVADCYVSISSDSVETNKALVLDSHDFTANIRTVFQSALSPA